MLLLALIVGILAVGFGAFLLGMWANQALHMLDGDD